MIKVKKQVLVKCLYCILLPTYYPQFIKKNIIYFFNGLPIVMSFKMKLRLLICQKYYLRSHFGIYIIIVQHHAPDTIIFQ